MGNIFGRRKVYWVPANKNIADKVHKVSEWKNAEDFTGWQMQNDPKGLELILKFQACENLVEVNLSFNGLGDDECQAIAKTLKGSRTLRRLDLSNNHIHAKGAQVLSEALTPRTGEKDPSLEGKEITMLNMYDRTRESCLRLSTRILDAVCMSTRILDAVCMRTTEARNVSVKQGMRWC